MTYLKVDKTQLDYLIKNQKIDIDFAKNEIIKLSKKLQGTETKEHVIHEINVQLTKIQELENSLSRFDFMIKTGRFYQEDEE